MIIIIYRGLSIHKGIILALETGEFVITVCYCYNSCYNSLCITVRGHWCDIAILNVHVPTEDKSDNMRTAFMRN